MRPLERIYGTSRSFAFAWDHFGAPRGRRVHLGSRLFTLARLGIVVFIWVRVDSLRRA